MLTMDLEEVLVRIVEYFDRIKAVDLQQWRMVRRLCFYLNLTGFGKVKINNREANYETDLWDIEGDQPTGVTEDKIKMWRKWLIDNGKMKGEA